MQCQWAKDILRTELSGSNIYLMQNFSEIQSAIAVLRHRLRPGYATVLGQFSHFINSQLINIEEVGIDKVGGDNAL